MDTKEVLLLYFKHFSIKKIKVVVLEMKLNKINKLQMNFINQLIKKKFKKIRVYSLFKDNIWGVGLADMQLINKFNKGTRFLLCVIDIFSIVSKYSWVVTLKDKKGVTIVNAFQKVLGRSNRKPNKIWVDKGSDFYNSSFIKWLKGNDIEMYSTYNQGKSVVAERFIRTLKNKNYKYMTSISENLYIDKLYDIVNEYNNTYHEAIKMKPVDVKSGNYVEYNVNFNDKYPKFQVGDHVRISKYKNIFGEGYTPNWSEEIFVIKKVQTTVPWIYVSNEFNGEEIIATFMKKNCRRLTTKNLE